MKKIMVVLATVLILLDGLILGCGQTKPTPVPTVTPTATLIPTPVLTPTPTPTPKPVPTPLPKGIYTINESGEMSYYKDEWVPFLYSSKSYLDGQLTLFKVEIGDDYLRVYSIMSVRKVQNLIFSDKPSVSNFVIDNLGKRYENINYGGDYAIPQSLVDGREYRGYADFKGRPLAGADTFFYYTFGIVKPLKFVLKEQQPILTESSKQRLAEKFAPILYFHPDEVYEPKDVRIMIENADLKRKHSMAVVPFDHTPLGLSNVPDSENLYLDLRRVVTEGASGYAKMYREIEAKYPTTIYARVLTQDNKTIVQYWLFYYFNDGPVNNHEGDWEVVQIVLNASEIPETISFSQHGRAVTRKWSEMTYLQNRPAVYVAKGSHSNYFYPGEPNIRFDEIWQAGEKENVIAPIYDSALLKVLNRTVKGMIKEYRLILLPEIDEQIKKEAHWLNFRGEWGEWLPEPSQLMKITLVSGPSAPITQEAWLNPLKWAGQ